MPPRQLPRHRFPERLKLFPFPRREGQCGFKRTMCRRQRDRWVMNDDYVATLGAGTGGGHNGRIMDREQLNLRRLQYAYLASERDTDLT